jgi:hypothetical protein
MNPGKHLCLWGLLFFLTSAAPAWGEVTFIVSPEGAGSFTIEGDDINLSAKVQMTVAYDSSVLTAPRTSVDGGTVSNVMDANPGTLIFDVNQGSEATPSLVIHLSFDTKGTGSGGIFSVRGKITELDGTITPCSTMPNPSSPSLLAWVSRAEEGEPLPAPEDAATAENWPDLPRKAPLSVLQRFREFTGKRSLPAYRALFRSAPGDLVQEPAVAISDGKALVRITFPWQVEEGGAPDIALSDATLVRSGVSDAKSWAVTVLPNPGSWTARLVLKLAEQVVEYPLVVAPPVKIPKGISEENFLAELDGFHFEPAGAGKGEGDQGRKTLSEYIFSANFLASGWNIPAMTASEPGTLLQGAAP